MGVWPTSPGFLIRLATTHDDGSFFWVHPKSSIPILVARRAVAHNMASLSMDSEFIFNYVSAVPIPAGSHHVTVLDEKRMPVMFCLSNDLTSPQLRVC